MNPVRRLFAVFALAGILLNAAPASAGGFGGAGPSSGTIIAAAMETAGYVSQAQILSQLNDMLTHLGALVYVCCLLSALLISGLAGRYQSALWLLVGPPMFFFLIRAESSAAGVEWQFGTFRDTGDLQKILRGANVRQAPGNKVSSFFHQYNVLISHSYQELIKILMKQSTRDQMMFMARQKIIDDLFGQRIDDPGLYQLTRFTNLICDQELGAARLVALGERDPEFKKTGEYQQAVREYCDLWPLRDKFFPNGPAKDWVKTLLRLDLEQDAPRLRTVSCEELWAWMERGTLQLATRELEAAMLRHIPRQAGPDIRPAILAAIREKLSRPSPFYQGSSTGFQCTTGTGSNTTMNVSQYQGVPFIMMTWILRGTFMEGPIQSQQVEPVRPNSNLEPATLGERAYSSGNRAQGQEVVRRFKNAQLGESMKYEAFMLAKLLPYFQGAGLYILATIYPFFCLMVLLPGHAGGFMVWLALWAWLKSWDIGWALVYVVDQLLWHLMPHRTYIRMANGQASANSASADPVTILEAAFKGDYSYSLTTYWVLLAGMLGAVPVISAHAILGSKRAIAGILVDGAKTIGQVFSKAAGDWVAMEQLGEIDRRIQQSSLFSRAAAHVEREHMQLFQMQQAMSAELIRNRSIAAQQLRAQGGRQAVTDANLRNQLDAGLDNGQPLQGAWADPRLNDLFGGVRQMWNNLAGNLTPGVVGATDMTPNQLAQRIVDLDRRIAEAEARAGDGPTNFGSVLRQRWETFRNSGEAGMRALARDMAIIEEYMNSGRTVGDQRNLAQRLFDATRQATGAAPGDDATAERRANEVYRNFQSTADRLAAYAAQNGDNGQPNLNRNLGGATPGLNRLLDTVQEQYMNSQALAVLGDQLLRINERRQSDWLAAGLTSAVLPGAAGRFTRFFSGTARPGLNALAQVNSFEVAELTRFYFATQALSIEMERGANAAASQYLILSSRHYLYQAARSDEFAAYERLRAGISGRPEWWSCPDAPYTLEMDADREVAHLQQLGAGWLGRMQVQGGITNMNQRAYMLSGGFIPK